MKYLQEDSSVNVKEISDGLYLDGPGKESAMIFYPGAKVEYTAYLPLLYELAEQADGVPACRELIVRI